MKRLITKGITFTVRGLQTYPEFVNSANENPWIVDARY